MACVILLAVQAGLLVKNRIDRVAIILVNALTAREASHPYYHG
jgi:hypothetical protein